MFWNEKSITLKGKKIIVAGISGRVGNAIGKYLIENGNEVWGYALFSKPGSQEYWEKLGVHTVKGDISKGEFEGLPTDADYCINLVANTMPGNYTIGLEANATGAALLMKYCKNVKAFLHFSTSAMYTPNNDINHEYTEEDPVGSKAEGFYSGTKIAGEGAVAATAKLFNIPTIQLRLSVYYGTESDGGLLSLVYLNSLVNHIQIEVIKDHPSYFSPIYDKDINRFLPSLLENASVDSPIVNFVSDEFVSVEEVVEYMSELTNIKPEYKYVDELSWPAMKIDPTYRKSITGSSKYSWKKGVKEFVEYWYPRLLEENKNDNTSNDGKFTKETKIGEISKLPGIVEFLSKKTGQKIAPFALKMGATMTIAKAGSILNWSDEQIKDIVDELNKKF